MKLPLIIFGLLFFSCKKDSQECETWLVQETCTANNSSVRCSDDPSPKEHYTCGSELEDARAGKIVVIRNDADIKRTRTYIRKVK